MRKPSTASRAQYFREYQRRRRIKLGKAPRSMATDLVDEVDDPYTRLGLAVLNRAKDDGVKREELEALAELYLPHVLMHLH